jgi:hypothetical protein
MKSRLSQMALQPLSLFQNPGKFFGDVAKSISQVTEYFRNTAFAGIYPFGWAPSHSFTAFQAVLNTMLYLLEGTVSLTALFGAYLAAAGRIWKHDLRAALGLSLAVSFFYRQRCSC